MNNLYALKAVNWWKTETTTNNDALVFIIVAAVAIAVIVIVNQVVKKNPRSGGGGGGGSPRRFSGFALRRLASGMNMNREQSKMLEYVFKLDGVTDIQHSVNSPTLLDRHFKRAYRAIERAPGTDEEAQGKMSLLFSTRNVVEANSSGGAVSSTRQVPENTTAVLNIASESYTVRVISVKGENLVVECPHTLTGGAVRLPRGSKASIAFFTKSSKGFSFETRIIGASNSHEGPVLQLAHSSQIKRLAQRRFKRRQAAIATTFYLVYLESSGRRGEKKLVVDKRRLTGTIMDISPGGSSIKTGAPVTSGTRLKIEFMLDDGSQAAALGQVLRTNRTGASTIMHIKFLRVPQRSMNMINAFVYEYIDE